MALKTLEKEQKKTAQETRKSDHRYFPRWEVNKRVKYYRKDRGGDDFMSYTKDLSLEGASIFVVGHPPIRHQVRLEIHLTDKKSFQAQGRVVWSKVETNHELFGIVFENLSQKAQELIMQHAFELREALRPHQTPPLWHGPSGVASNEGGAQRD